MKTANERADEAINHLEGLLSSDSSVCSEPNQHPLQDMFDESGISEILALRNVRCSVWWSLGHRFKGSDFWSFVGPEFESKEQAISRYRSDYSIDEDPHEWKVFAVFKVPDTDIEFNGVGVAERLSSRE